MNCQQIVFRANYDQLSHNYIKKEREKKPNKETEYNCFNLKINK